MKRNVKAILMGGGVLLAASAIALPVYAQGQYRFGMNRSSNADRSTNQSITTAPSGTLNASEKQDVQYMLEEEKLAHDLYAAFYQKWGDKIFLNISNSETKHEALVKTAADYYGVTDTRSPQAGVFTNADLQKLYDTLLAKGLQSRTNAFEAGKTVEEQDISDLGKALNDTSNTYLKSVYERLQNGSEHHLNAFNRQLGS